MTTESTGGSRKAVANCAMALIGALLTAGIYEFGRAQVQAKSVNPVRPSLKAVSPTHEERITSLEKETVQLRNEVGELNELVTRARQQQKRTVEHLEKILRLLDASAPPPKLPAKGPGTLQAPAA
jgi:hypothetical protein